MMHVRFAGVTAIITSSLLTGCSIVGNNIDKHLHAGGQGHSRIYVDGNGEGRHVVPASQDNSYKAGPFTAMGDDVDKAIFKSLMTRRMQNDMAIRDEGGCLEGELKVCSVSAGCACEEKRTRTTQQAR